ncbi:heptaprenyl diphosphate synthase component 1 [Sutcliffiella horikoshii]|uniref:Heptaprenyl diphosphate synthase component 1 n=1 Tax=Sutcliffiella horikoshii TaxID=79883 RepID=A0A5D4T1R5_9BACI|nr:heptaprenyl diphosphate synthase component 1 [Sutcliffiella horikoshii]
MKRTAVKKREQGWSLVSHIHISIIKEKLHNLITHPYLIKHIEYPAIDEDKLLLLYSILEPIDISDEKKEQYILSTMLVQIALDTHDMVTNAKAGQLEVGDEKSRQLTVLAGDFYSGLYYRLLADVNDISMIKTLAHSIKQINEHKIAYYHKELEGIEPLMDSLGKIESSLIQSVSGFFSDSLLKELGGNFLLLKRLIQERKLFCNERSTFLFDTLRRIAFSKGEKDVASKEQETYMLYMIDRYIDHIKQKMEQLTHTIPTMNNLLEARIQELFYEIPFSSKKYAEEG